jgi:hypothetical protein
LKISRSQLYAILNGEIKRPPDWTGLVRPLVDACTGGDARMAAEWRRRHAVLVGVWEELSRRDRRNRARRSVAPAGTAALAGRGDQIEQGVSPVAAVHALPCDTASFAGRVPELDLLVRELETGAATGSVVGVHAIDGMAGVGKTAFAVHAAHLLASRFPDGQFFLPLHSHTPGQQPADPGAALGTLLLAAGIVGSQVPDGADSRAMLWRHGVAGKKILLVLDDAASHEQVRPLLPGTPGSPVLITSRRRLAAAAFGVVALRAPLAR